MNVEGCGNTWLGVAVPVAALFHHEQQPTANPIERKSTGLVERSGHRPHTGSLSAAKSGGGPTIGLWFESRGKIEALSLGWWG